MGTTPPHRRGLRAGIVSCASCLGWGQTYTMGLCAGCYCFPLFNPETGACGACRRVLPLKKGYCRLCWCQAEQNRRHHDGDARSKVVMAPHLRDVRFHQLFLLWKPPRTPAPPPRIPRRRGAKGRPLKPPPPIAIRPAGRWLQPPLFPAPPRTFGYGRFDLRSQPVPDNPWLAWALHLAHTMAQARGWSAIVRCTTQRTLVMLLAGHADGDTIRTSDIHQVISRRSNSFRRAVEILDTMGVLDDDRPTSFDLWLQRKLDSLAPGITVTVDGWARALLHGTSRTLPRSQSTVAANVRVIQPALLDWSAAYDHLREVTRADVLAQLDALHGHHRQTVACALRSLFRWAKRGGVIFRDPTSRIKTPRLEHPVFQPLSPDQIARTVVAATAPHARLFVALAAVHAARPFAIRALRLDDIDLGNRRITISRWTRPLDDLTHRLLIEWLEYRRQRWPDTANPHLLISKRTAVGTEPVSQTLLAPLLRGLPATIERLRIDRQLEEALTHGPDPLHLTKVFGIAEDTAVRYANSARDLLTRPHEDHPVSSPGTRASGSEISPDEPLGSR
ncbi:tyrosine-type recombinase/integrase [Nonomuraea insulae]|uniref:Tyrosine-type recombinase/integrase n=1 Tax=Nonomuraea insulae TaxID=1616787 RepID=A0ABW1CQK1_9ACTN